MQSSYKRLTLSTLLSCLLLLPTPFFRNAHAQTYDLLDVYRAAKKNDPQWAQEEEGYFAKAQSKNLARAGLLPQIQAGASQSTNHYSGPSTSFSLSADRIEACQLNASDPIDVSNAITALNCLASPTDASSSFSSTNYSVNLVQPIVRLERWYQYKGAEAITEQAKLEREKALQDLILRTSEAYFQVLRAHQGFVYASQQEENMQAQLNGVQKRYERGILNSADVYQIQAMYDVAYAYKVSAENLLYNAVNLLEKITQVPAIQIAPLPDHLPVDLPKPNTATAWVDIAKKNSPELKIATLGISAANHNHQAKKSLHAPTVDFFTAYSQTESDGSTATLNQGSTNYTSVGVNLNVPIFTGGYNSAATKQAKHQMRQAEYVKENVYQEVVTNTQVLFRNVSNTVARVKAQSSALSSNQKAFHAVARGYEQGVKSAADLAVSQKDLYSAQKDFANAKYDFILDALQLKRVAGVLTENDLKLINDRLEESSHTQAPHTQTSPEEINSQNEHFDEPRESEIDYKRSEPKKQTDKTDKKSFIEVIEGWL